MVPASSESVTSLLRVWRHGDQGALERLVELCYPELQKIARGCLKRERSEHTIQATELVHEAYLRLIDARQVSWQDRVHFFAITAKLMRRILTDHARARASSKRGSGARPMELNEALTISPKLDRDIVKLDDALQALAKFDSRKAQVVEMRYFGGLTADEIAHVLEISRESVNRDWSLARAWLNREMTRVKSDGCPPLGSH